MPCCKECLYWPGPECICDRVADMSRSEPEHTAALSRGWTVYEGDVDGYCRVLPDGRFVLIDTTDFLESKGGRAWVKVKEGGTLRTMKSDVFRALEWASEEFGV